MARSEEYKSINENLKALQAVVSVVADDMDEIDDLANTIRDQIWDVTHGETHGLHAEKSTAKPPSEPALDLRFKTAANAIQLATDALLNPPKPPSDEVPLSEATEGMWAEFDFQGDHHAGRVWGANDGLLVGAEGNYWSDHAILVRNCFGDVPNNVTDLHVYRHMPESEDPRDTLDNPLIDKPEVPTEPGFYRDNAHNFWLLSSGGRAELVVGNQGTFYLDESYGMGLPGTYAPYRRAIFVEVEQ